MLDVLLEQLWSYKLYVMISAVTVVIYLLLRKRHVHKLKITLSVSENDPRLKHALVHNISTKDNPSHIGEGIQPDSPFLEHQNDDSSLDEKGVSRFSNYSPAVADALISSAPSIIALDNIDLDVFEAIRHSASRTLDLSQWSNLKDYLDDHYFEVGSPDGFLNRLVGYVGEVKAHEFFEQTGHHVQLAELSNQPGYDMHVDGTPVNIKTGGVQTIKEHFEKYPDISVATGSEQATAFQENDMVIGLPILEKTGLEEATNSTLDLTDNDFDAGGPTIPTVTTIVSGYRELNLLIKGHTDVSSALKNAGLDIAGTGLGGWAGAKTGALIGSPAGPAGTVIGGLIGSVSGIMIGRFLTNAKKKKPFKQAVNNYNLIIASAESSIKLKETEINCRLSKRVEEEEGRHKKSFNKLNSILNQDVHKLNNWSNVKCHNFIKSFVDMIPNIEIEWKNFELKELKKTKRSSFFIRLLWPSSSDIEYYLMAISLRSRMKKLREIQRYLKKDFQNKSEVDAVIKIKEFLLENPLGNKDIEKMCLKIAKYNKAAKIKHAEVMKTAKLVADRININNRLEIQKATHQSYDEIGELIAKWKADIENARDVLIKEAKKIGIDIDQDEAP